MSTEQLITDMLADRAYLAPDPDATLAGVHRALRTRRRTALAVGGTVATVAAVAVTVAAAGVGTHVGSTAPAAGSPQPSNRPASTPQPSRPASPSTTFSRIVPEWLPPGARQLDPSEGSNGWGYRFSTAQLGQSYLAIDFAQAAVLPTTYKRGTPVDLTVAGHPAREWSVDDWYRVAVQLRPDLVATIDIESGDGKGADGSAAALAAVGRQVAAGLRASQVEVTSTELKLTALPDGIRILVQIEQPNTTTYEIGPTTYEIGPTDLAKGTQLASVQRTTQTWSQFVNGRRPTSSTLAVGRPVQGHRTYEVTTDGKRPVLWVDQVRPGMSLQLTGGPGVTTMAQLYAIADGIQLG